MVENRSVGLCGSLNSGCGLKQKGHSGVWVDRQCVKTCCSQKTCAFQASSLPVWGMTQQKNLKRHHPNLVSQRILPNQTNCAAHPMANPHSNRPFPEGRQLAVAPVEVPTEKSHSRMGSRIPPKRGVKPIPLSRESGQSDFGMSAPLSLESEDGSGKHVSYLYLKIISTKISHFPRSADPSFPSAEARLWHARATLPVPAPAPQVRLWLAGIS